MSNRPGLVLRLAVVIGTVTLLAGLTGLVMMALRPDVPPPSGSTAPGGELRLGGDAVGATPRVEILWTDGDTRITQEATPGETKGTWVLPPVPDATNVVLRVRRGEDGRIVHQVEYEDGLPDDLVVDTEGD